MTDILTKATVGPAAGPLDPPSSRPRAGVLGGEVFSYAFRPADGVQRLSLPLDLVGRVAGPHTELHWAFYTDDSAAVRPPWPSLAVCPDVVFDDGSRLTDGVPERGPAVDRYGFDVTPSAQFAARWSMPQQWNADTVSLAAWDGRRVQSVDVLLGDDSLTALVGSDEVVHGFVELVLVENTAAEPGSPAERVDTRRGTHTGPGFSRGNNLPAVALPHGFVFAVPTTNEDTRWPYRWHVHDEPAGRRLAAIQTSHQPSPWIGDHGVLRFLPWSAAAASATGGHIVPGTEVARPHRYAAQLAEDIELEATTTSAVVALRVRGNGPCGLILDQPENRASMRVRGLPDGRVAFSGWVAERADADWGNAPRMYVHGETARPATMQPATVQPATVSPGESADGLGTRVTASDGLELRVATSFLSIEQAQRTLALEASWRHTFDDLIAQARARWDVVCGAVEVQSPTDDRYTLAHRELLAKLSHALYRLHLYPNTAAENAGTEATPDWRFADVFAAAAPHGEEATGAPIASGRLVVNNGYWDTYRTVWPLLAVLDDELAGDLLNGQLEQVRRGDWTARWSGPGYIDCMVGTSSDQVYAQAARLGVSGFDRELAYESGWRNACEPSPDVRTGRASTATARFTGYVPREVQAGLSWTIEAAIGDSALGDFAALLAETASDPARYAAHARYFANRALSYRQLFDPGTGFFRGRDRQGALADEFDPAVWGGDYVETNAWGMSVSAVHDGAGLAALLGGPDRLRRHLDRLFAEPETIVAPYHAGDLPIHEQLEARALRSGMCALSNQPAHHIPFMYLHTDQPWRAAPLVRELAGRLFCGGHIGQGFPGDEDNGEMSGWWLLALLGLYPLDPGSGELVIGAPLVDDVTVRRAVGTLQVRVTRESPDARYLAAASWNGRALTRPVLSPVELAEPGVLELELVVDPPVDAPLWRGPEAAPAEWRPDLSFEEFAIASRGLDGRVAFDDGADPDGCCMLKPGDWVGQDFGAPQRVSDLTLTVVDAAAADAFVVEHSVDGVTWREAVTTHREPLPADRTTPFQLVNPVIARHWRIRVDTPVRLRQVEFFDL